MMTILLTLLAALSMPQQEAPFAQGFTMRAAGEAVATIDARCQDCDWGVAGREAAVLEISVDGTYSQHLVLSRGGLRGPYRVMLGPLDAGNHRLVIRRDAVRSSRDAGRATVLQVEVAQFAAGTPEHAWLSRAPFLRARPGALEKFSDVPLLMYAEQNVPGENGGTYRFQYTAVFSNEDGGTAADRLMATWGRTTDIEFVYGVTADNPSRELIQGENHRWVEFNGPKVGAHPMLWVSTLNNMVADRGPDDAVRFAPAPELVDLSGKSREAVMDATPWTYAVTSAEAAREGRIDPSASAGSGKIPDPRRYATFEVCGDVTDATLAFDIAVQGTDGAIAWHASDRGQTTFRIARGGCFRGGSPMPDGIAPGDIKGLRARAYTRPPPQGQTPDPARRGSVTIRRVNHIAMLNSNFVPQHAGVFWSGEMPVNTNGEPVVISLPGLKADRLPASLSDAEFWSLIGQLSEPDGRFRSFSGSSDNLLSNERGASDVATRLAARVRQSGVYLGVGPEQNFTYIAATRPRIAFITDIRRGNLLVLLMYKALFELSSNRADFFARLFNRRGQAQLTSTSTAADLMRTYEAAPPNGDADVNANLRAILDHLTRLHEFPLSPDDVAAIESVYRTFHKFGPAIHYNSSNGVSTSPYPSYAQLMSATDAAGRERSYLASDDDFAFVKSMHSKNLIVPLVGDFAGPKTLRAVGKYLRDREAVVTAFYISDVETYLEWRYSVGAAGAFCANVATMPLDAGSTFIRPNNRGIPDLGSMAVETMGCAGR